MEPEPIPEPPPELYGYCYGCGEERAVVMTGPHAFTLKAHPGRTQRTCSGTGRRPAYYCSGPPEPCKP